MKVLLDECLPRRLKFRLSSHACKTVPQAGFTGKTNGGLLTLAEEAGFQVFIMMDRGIPYQQNLVDHKLGIVLLQARTNQYVDLLPLVEYCLLSIDSVDRANFKPSEPAADHC